MLSFKIKSNIYILLTALQLTAVASCQSDHVSEKNTVNHQQINRSNVRNQKIKQTPSCCQSNIPDRFVVPQRAYNHVIIAD